MKLTLNRTLKQPLYLQVYEQLKEAIVGGSYATGAKLPSKRCLAEEGGISLITVEHAYALLEEEGYLQTREKSGYYVVYQEADYFSACAVRQPAGFPQGNAKQAKKPVPIAHLPFSREEKEAFPFSAYAKALRRVLSGYHTHLYEKSPNCGLPEFRQALAAYLFRSRGICVTADQIVIGSGSESLYGLMIRLLGADRVYGIESPSYQKIEQVYSLNGVAFEKLPLGADGIDTQALDRTAATVLHLTPYRSFPSGVTASAAKRRAYIRFANQRNGFLIEDDFESEFTLLSKLEETLFSLADRQNVIYMNTFSKTIAPSVRVGYMVLPPPLMAAFEATCGFLSCPVSTLGQSCLAEVLNNGEFERHINRVRRQRRRESRTPQAECDQP